MAKSAKKTKVTGAFFFSIMKVTGASWWPGALFSVATMYINLIEKQIVYASLDFHHQLKLTARSFIKSTILATHSRKTLKIPIGSTSTVPR
jgi:hypothetical protein